MGGVGGGRRKGDKVPEIMTATAFLHSLKACWGRFSSRKSHRSNQEAEGQDVHLLICKFIPPTKRNTVKKKKSRPVCARALCFTSQGCNRQSSEPGCAGEQEENMEQEDGSPHTWPRLLQTDMSRGSEVRVGGRGRVQAEAEQAG